MLRKEARERYQSFSEEEKDKRRKNARERYQNLTDEEKEKESVIRIFLRNKSIRQLSTEEIII